MLKVLAAFTLTLSIILFPPAALALISNNAVSGEPMYPVKRKLEEGILFLASFNSNIYAWFSVERSDRRFIEIQTLANQDDPASDKLVSATLNDLVEQTKSAVSNVQTIEDKDQKVELIDKLNRSIISYNQGLSQVQKKLRQRTSLPSPTFAPEPTETVIPPPTLAPSPQLAEPIDDTDEDLEEAKEKLEELRRNLGKERKELNKQNKEEKQREKDNKKSVKPEGKDTKE